MLKRILYSPSSFYSIHFEQHNIFIISYFTALVKTFLEQRSKICILYKN